ncbi:MAG TPA: NPCBM/NEW2 domain-containing protein [Pirellulaceae bacterium]|nr:NPCBM/NEW2 domain-containing protein [Pirellulaceae bacterium]
MWTIVAISLLGWGADVQVSTLAGAQATGALQQLNTQGVVIQSANGEQTFAANELLSIQPKSIAKRSDSTKPTVWIELIDGSRLLATQFTATGGLARAALLGGETVEIPTRSIHSVRFKAHDSELALAANLPKQWQEILASEATGDLIVIRKVAATDEEEEKPAPAKASAALDQLEGVVGDVTEEKVLFTYDDQQIPVARAKVEGVVYFHAAGRELPDPLCRVDDVTGSRWNVKSLTLSGEALQLVSTSGVKAELPLNRWRQLDYSAGKIVYLSDLEPETETWTNYYGGSAVSPQLAKLFAPRRDRSFSGDALTVDGQEYRKGLAIHSRTLLEYRLQGKFNKFLAVAGIDQQVRTAGNIKLVVSLDGKKLSEYTIASDDEAPVVIEHDIQGGRKLSLFVDYGTGLDLSDRLHLGNARVTK